MYTNSINKIPCPHEALSWAASSIQSEIISCTPLKGSTSSTLYELVSASGQKFVLRLFTLTSWLETEPDLARHEAAVLERVQQENFKSPHLIAFDEFGTNTIYPAVLMTKLEGQVELKPSNFDQWLKLQAHTLHQIHQTPIDNFSWQYKHWFDLNELSVPSWTKQPTVFREMIDILKSPPPEVPLVFLHRDYHPTNILWDESRLSGIVDWVNGCIGPAMIDVGHCRLNLASLFGIQAAEAFLENWKSVAPSRHYSPWWDICAFANGGVFSNKLGIYSGWADFGKNDISIENLADRLDQLAVAMARAFI
ncbi:MAG: aminoglycoside phosphotransferase family protein [Chloroflexota bacterium]